jgi:hypothetical protein
MAASSSVARKGASRFQGGVTRSRAGSGQPPGSGLTDAAISGEDL